MLKTNLFGVRAATRHAVAAPAASVQHHVAAPTEASVRLNVET